MSTRSSFTIKNPAALVGFISIGVTSDQWLRELFHNEIEAGASSVRIDPYTGPDGRTLTRVTGNGKGMTPKELGNRMKEVACPTADANFGVGARVSTLRYNKGGVYWVSKTATTPESMILVYPDGIEQWQQADGTLEEVVVPDSGMLPTWIGPHGTSVILNGDGHNSTWHKKLESYRMGAALAERYWQFGPQNATLHIHGFATGKDSVSRVPSTKELIDYMKTSEGTVLLSDGTAVDWYIINKHVTNNNWRSLLKPGACILDGMELYNRSKEALKKFGIYWRNAPVVLVVRPVRGILEANIQRSMLVRSDDGKHLMPWKQWGEEFSRNCPQEILDLVPKSTIPVTVSDLTRYFDREWFKGIAPTIRGVVSKAKATVSGVAEDFVVTTSVGISGTIKPHVPIDVDNDNADQKDEEEDKNGGETSITKPKEQRKQHRKAVTPDPDGKARGQSNVYPEPPRTVLVMKADWDYGDAYDFAFEEAHNHDGVSGPALLVKEGGYAIEKQTELWVAKRPDLDASLIAQVVSSAYTIEQIAKILTMTSQFAKREGWTDELTGEDGILSPRTLTVASWGMISANELIGRMLAEAARAEAAASEEVIEESAAA